MLTHRGRSSSSGHYVAWVKGDAPDSWYKCDDDVVSPITDKEVLKLSGGGMCEKQNFYLQLMKLFVLYRWLACCLPAAVWAPCSEGAQVRGRGQEGWLNVCSILLQMRLNWYLTSQNCVMMRFLKYWKKSSIELCKLKSFWVDSWEVKL